jgi:predicted dehydrogenase
MGRIELAALVDPSAENAEIAADEAEKLFGARPPTVRDLDELPNAAPEVQAVDITAGPWLHHRLATQAMDMGYHVSIEKPMGVTVKACQIMKDASERTGKVLSVAENYRRDPLNRLARHVIDAELLGRVYFMMQHAMSGGRTILQTPWRHDKLLGGFILDMGVHYADILMYYLGEFDEFYASAELIERTRTLANGRTDDPILRSRMDHIPENIEATSEDFSAAHIRMKSGANVHWALSFSSQPGLSHRHVYGTAGRMDASAGARSGRPLKLKFDDRELEGEEILEAVPDYELDELTSRLFGKRCTSYNAAELNPDACILAIEYDEFARAVLDGVAPEVGPDEGMAAVAAIYAILESANAGCAVKMKDVLSGSVHEYQTPINEHHGI